MNSNSNNLKSNPFANLFDSINEVENFLPSTSKQQQQNLNTDYEKTNKINNLFERIFQLTLRKNFTCNNEHQPLFSCIFMGEESDDQTSDQSLLSKENIDEVILTFN